MTDEREYWRSAIVGRIDKQQPVFSGELLDEIVGLRAQLVEAMTEIQVAHTQINQWHFGIPERDDNRDLSLSERISALATLAAKARLDCADLRTQLVKANKRIKALEGELGNKWRQQNENPQR